MNQKWKRRIASWLSFLYLFQVVAATASTPVAQITPSTSASQSLSLNTNELGLTGPFSFGLDYDTLEKTIFKAQFAKKLTDDFALGLIGEYGVNQYRLNATAGLQLYKDDAIKIGAERLSQNLPFSFDSGDIDQRVAQNAYGLRFQHNVNDSILQNVNFGAYWANAPNIALPTLDFTGSSNQVYSNQRNIAGATSKGLDVGAALLLSPSTSLEAALNYDQVRYNTELVPASSSNSQGLGETLRLSQLIGDKLKISAKASDRSLYDVYGLELAYAPDFSTSLDLKITASGERLISSNNTPDSNTYGIKFSASAAPNGKASNFALAGLANKLDLDQWVKTPAIYMNRVLAVAEQITTLVKPIITSITLNHGLLAGGNVVTISGQNFIPGTQISFGSTPATGINLISAQQITVIVPPAAVAETVDVTVSNPGGQSYVAIGAYTYQTILADTHSDFVAPTVTAVSPNVGPLTGGTSVSITGTNFTGATAVKFAATAATSFTVNSSTSITAVSPAKTAGTVDIKVTTAGGTSATNAGDKFTYENVPTVTSVSPNAGALTGGTSVTITGTNFTGVTGVNFGGTAAASFTFNSATSITAVSPAGSAGTVDITVVTPLGTSATSAADQFTYEGLPTVTAISPAIGTTSGGTTVTVTGTNFTGATAVKFGATAGTSLTVVSSTELTIKSPANAGGTVDITVTTPLGTSATSAADQFLYEGSPTVTAVSPNVGPAAGGTAITLTGTNFTGVTAVKFASLPAASFNYVSPTQITAVTPAGSASSTYHVLVTTPVNTSTSSAANLYTYYNVPTVTSVSPSFGPISGGTLVTITGTGLTGTTAVNFGASPASSFTIVSGTKITATAPAGVQGIVDITVTTPGGTSVTSSADQFSYQGVPTITGISPAVGPVAGNKTITITGTNLSGVTAVNFGGTAAKSFSITSSTTMTAVSPAGALGTVDITVTNPSGTSSTSVADQYTYEGAPTVTAVSPNSGPLTGGTLVTLTGSNFTGATAVKFGTIAAPSFSVISSTQLTAVSPANSGSVNVTVITPVGTSPVSAADKFDYENNPSVTSVTPNGGPTAGGNSVVIVGANFTDATAVNFGTTPAASFTVNTAAKITAIAPPGVAGTIDITVTTNTGTSTTSSSDQYIYANLPTVVGVTPNVGPTAGGTVVTITGTNFTTATAVSFAKNAATAFTVINDTQITATAPAGVNTTDITVTTLAGISATSAADQFTYYVIPKVTAINPASGPSAGGTIVSLKGTNFLGTTAVTFGGTSVSFTVNSSTSISATAPAGAGVLDINVTTPGGTSANSSANQYSYTDSGQVTPIVSWLTPASGPLEGGSLVTITGTSFTGVTAVNFGGTPATNFNFVNDSTVTATSPPGSGNVAVTVTTSSGTSSTEDNDIFTYEAAPAVTSVSPVAGATDGGTSVIITGTGFTDASAVYFGNTAAANFSVTSATSITAISPSGTGVVDITVVNPSGTSTTSAADQFLYEDVPVISGVSPLAGATAGATSVTISGSNFTDASAVSFGGRAATSFTVNSATSITAITPAGSGTVDVQVTNPVGISSTSSADQFIFEDLPTVSGLSPTAGVPAGGAFVVIEGTNLQAASAVNFGGTPAASFAVNNSTSIIAVSPPGVGTVDVMVTTPLGTSATSSADQFLYQGVPVVTGLSPNAGTPLGGNSVTISGSNFNGATDVFFGTTDITSFTINSNSSITVTAPAGTGTVDVVVVTAVASSAKSSADQYTYEGTPTVIGVSPTLGSIAGGTSVTITGTNFNAATAVNFGSTPAISFMVNSSTSITALSPSGSPGTVDITVVTPVGTSGTSAADQFTYEGPPTVTAVNPVAGIPGGGQSVNITGTNFTGTLGVNFGNVAAASFSVNSATSITAVTPPGVGTVDVLVLTQSGLSPTSAADQFTFEAAPTVTGVSPPAGVNTGGSTVTITGTNFTAATTVSFGNTAASNIIVNSSTSITATTPAGNGSVDVTVTTPVGTSATSNVDQFTYEGLPIVTGIGPGVGLPAGGATVTITGNNFNEVSAVNFGATPASSFTFNTATSITAIAPAGTGTVDVTVTTPVGISAISSADQFIYEGVPTVTGVSPIVGTNAGGTVVTITGTNFTGATTVNFGGTAASNFTVNSPSSITATSPAGSGNVDITVTTPIGTSGINGSDQFTYEGTPSVTGISPGVGSPAGGTTVTITGTNFLDATAVNFGNNAATNFTVNSATSITATSPAGAGIVDISVTTPVGTSAAGAADLFTYEAAPTVTAISPNAGVTAGGTLVTITGTNFTDATAVSFAGTPATSFTVINSTSISATAPLGAGLVDITVTTPMGTSTTSVVDQFVYEDVPSVTGVGPIVGIPAGGTSVTITGSNFNVATAVNFGTTPATTFTLNSATSITAIAPAGTGTVDLTVTTPVGTSATSTVDQFTYETAPTVTAVSPAFGPNAGGTVVTITGSNFIGATAVNFGGVAASSFSVNNSSSITATAPAGIGIVDITVATTIGTSSTSSADQFVYEGTPTVTAIDPAAGPIAGGTSVTITGSSFIDATAVNFGGVAATSFTVNSATSITATSPAGGGSVDVTVTNLSGTSPITTADQFVYEGTPTITGLSLTAGLPTGGTVINITGTNLLNATAVNFGGVAASSFTVNSATSITASSPAGSGTVDVTITTPLGTSPLFASDQFTYELPPLIASISPVAGVTAGGSTVTITGANFINATAVNFGGVAATSFTVNNPTSITATSPAGTGTVDVSVTTPLGSSVISVADQFTYEDLPSVTAVGPMAGVPAGGTVVTITGSNFLDATAVNFGNSAASSFSVTSPTSITATAPAGTGVVDVTVTTPVGISTIAIADQYIYENAPTITSIGPVAGVPGGGTNVTISGSNFSATSAVQFGGVAATSFTVNSSSSISAVAPAGSGAVDVTVTTPVGTNSATVADVFTYENVPTVTALSPPVGVGQGGTLVTITGTDFSDATAVNFGGTAALNFTIQNPTTITATSPAGSGAVDVTVTTPVGTSLTTSADQFVYEATPSVTAISPSFGSPAGGTLVTITGTNFTDATAVNFGAVAASSFTVNNPTSITATSPVGSGTVDVTVTTPIGTSVTSAADQFIYQGQPSVAAVSPAMGSPAGGTLVTITGSNFTNATAVNFGNVPATSFTVNSAISITATSPVGSGNVDITVTTIMGTSSISGADQFTYVGAPAVTALGPAAGAPAGGAVINITGNNFTGVTAVNFGTKAASSFTVNSPTSITATAPSGTGVVDVMVTTPVGTSSSSSADQFIYENEPTVTSISPVAGHRNGGTSVTITGSNFGAATRLEFGGVAASNFTVDSSTQITAVSPPGAGIANIIVTTPVSSSSASIADQFSYEDVPSVTGVFPAAGPNAGGTIVTITGTNFNDATAVYFGNNITSAIRVVSDTEIMTLAPAGSGTADITIVTPIGTSHISSADQYVYQGVPALTKVSPSIGSTGGGTLVRIMGIGLSNATAVSFGNTAASSFTVVSDTEITTMSPPGSGVVHLTVVTPGGTSLPSTITSQNGITEPSPQFQYTKNPIVAGISPTDGPASGGTTVTISGENFTGTTAVIFGFNFATDLIVNSDTSITVTSPPGVGVVNVAVSTNIGNSVVSGQDQFTYNGSPNSSSKSSTSAVAYVAGAAVGGAVLGGVLYSQQTAAASSSINLDLAIKHSRILKILKEDKQLSSREIQNKLAKDFASKLSLKNVEAQLSTLEEHGLVTAQKVGGKIVWKLS